MTMTPLPPPPTAPPSGPPAPSRRLLRRAPLLTDDLPAHLRRYGSVPAVTPARLIDEVEASGLLGRGGAGFPTGRKLRAVASGRGRAVVVANGCEGEPASAKDQTLLLLSPHLVLDGVQLAARAVGADRAHLVVHEGSAVLPVLRAALAERAAARLDRVRVQLSAVPDRYVSSEESALVHHLNGGPALPTATPPRPYEKGVARRPTLISNVETLAQLALVARYGAAWFRSVGDPAEPGTLLLTVTGPDVERRVVEVPTGTTVGAALATAGVALPRCRAVLVGGYFGSWFGAEEAAALPLTHAALRAAGGGLGAGILIALPAEVCAVREIARVAGYLADGSAGQCGPCLNGLPAIAGALQRLAEGPWDESLAGPLRRWLGIVPGRGACRLPDGAVRFVSTALAVFGDEVDRHRAGLPCRGRTAPVLPVPSPRSLRVIAAGAR